MPSTHAWIHLHVVFSTKGRLPLIGHEWRGRLHSFLGEALRRSGVLPLAIGGVEDHVHLLFALRPNQRASDIVRDIKAHSSHWIRETLGVLSFGWQDGYGVFTVSPERDQVLREYIEDQEAHHRQRPYQAEYVALLKQHAIEHDSNHLW